VLDRIYYLGPAGNWFQFRDDFGAAVLVHAGTLQVIDKGAFDSAYAVGATSSAARPSEAPREIEEAWGAVLQRGPSSGTAHYVSYPELIEPYEWTYGCSPTSAAMAISYWDHYVSGTGKYTSYGKLLEYYVTIRDPCYGTWGNVYNVPAIIGELRWGMNTGRSTAGCPSQPVDYGGTDWDDVHTGIEAATSAVGYSFTSNRHYCDVLTCWWYDWFWGVITAEIDDDRPFVWSVAHNEGEGAAHSLCAFGYTSDKFVITYNTWDTAEHAWYYTQYDNLYGVSVVQVDTVEPGGGNGGEDILLDYPTGGEVLQGDTNIWFYQYGDAIEAVTAYYFYEDEYSSVWEPTLYYIDSTDTGSEGWHSVPWTLPLVTGRTGFRVALVGESIGGSVLSRDGSPGVVFVDPCSSPAAPTGVSATDGAYPDRIRITWSSVGSATRYDVYRGDSEGGSYGKIGDTSGTSYNDTNANTCQTYWYKVKACNGCGCSGYSSSNSGYRGSAPSSPTNVTASDGTYTSYVRVSWSSVGSATRYNVYRADSEGGSYGKIGDTTGTSYNDTSANTCQTYWYKVKACNGCGCSGYSSSNSGYRGSAPSSPTNVTASDGMYTSYVRVSWSSVGSATRYNVYRADSEGGSYGKIGDTTGTSYNDTSANTCQTYWYKVKACNGCGCSGYSSANSGYRGSAPSAPTNVTAGDGTYTSYVRVGWSGVSGATRYDVYRADSQYGSYGKIADTTGTSYNDSTAAVCRTYWYKVTACNGCGCSGYSGANDGYRGSAPPAPTNVTASDGTYTSYVRVSWSAVSGAARYDVYRADSQNGSYGKIGDATGTTYSDTSAATCQTYWYKVTACNGCGCSGYSSSNDGYRGSAPSAPTSVTASDGTYADRVAVSWSGVSGAGRYDVYRADSQAGSYGKIGDATGTSYNDTGAVTCQTYWYKVIACNGCGCSGSSTADAGLAGTVPGVPTNVAASDGTYADRVAVSWSGVSGAGRYDVYRADSQYGSYGKIGDATGTSYNDTGAVTCQTYWYKVIACNGCGCGGTSTADAGLAGTVPGVPTNVAASDGAYADRVAVSWTGVAGATRYDVYRADSQAGSYAKIGDATGTSYNDSTAATCQTYWYKVAACNACGCSGSSTADAGLAGTVPGVPTNVAASDGTYADRVAVNWTAAAGATRYDVYRADSQYGSYGKIGDATGTSYNDSTAATCQTYWYKVAACNACGCSGSSTADAGLAGTVPGVPTNVAASDGTYADRVAVNWTAAAGATRYDVYRADSQYGSYGKIGDTSGTTYTDVSAVPGTTYWYCVCACSACGCGAPSLVDSGYARTIPDSGYAESFEGDVSGWRGTGLWHLTERESRSPSHSFWFGDEATGNYERRWWNRWGGSMRSSGNLTSPVIPVTGGQAAMLSFWYWREVESYAAQARDVTSVWVRYGAGAWQEVWRLDSRTASGATWTASPQIALAVPVGVASLQVEFRFDSVNGTANRYTGWFVDDVAVSQNTCVYQLTPAARGFGIAGGDGTVSVVATRADCDWTAAVDVGWITITSGGAGPGSKTLSYTVGANAGGERTGHITVGEATHTVTQEGLDCTVGLAPEARAFGVEGGSGTVEVTLPSALCDWTARADVGWVTITSGGAGPGSKTLSYTVAANAGGGRTGHITVDGATHTVTQSGRGYAESFEGDVSGWRGTGLWHLTERESRSPSHSFWFGDEASGTYERLWWNRWGGSMRSSGNLSSPVIPVTGGQAAMLSFWYWREVESYTAQARDVTSVWVRYGAGAWQEVWRLDSRTASAATWTASPQIALAVPVGVASLQVEFRFDSVNGTANRYTGWFVDDVAVSQNTCVYQLTPAARGFGIAGGDGTVSVVATRADCDWTAAVDVGWITITSGGAGPGSKTLSYTVGANAGGERTGHITVGEATHTVTQEGLDCTVGLAPEARAFGVEGGSGTVEVTLPSALCDWTARADVGWVTITSGGAGPGSKTLSYTVAANAGGGRTGHITVDGATHTVTQSGRGYAESFEGDVSGWRGTGLWHLTERESRSPSHGFWFGDDATGSYEQRSRNRWGGPMRSSGNLSSPVIPVTGGQAAVLSFWYWREVESYTAQARDVTSVWVRYGAGAWQEVWRLDSCTASAATWTASPQIALAVPVGVASLRVEFRFDSVNGTANRYTGWFVDDVQVCGAGAGPLGVSLPDAAERSPQVEAVPNPVRDLNTTYFSVSGVAASAIRVRIYDLSGRRVWESECACTDLPWHTEGLDGLPLANGVYLYTASVLVNGEWLELELDKVVILR